MGIPRSVRRQQWSALNVPLLVPGREVAIIGFTRHAQLGIESREELSTSRVSQGHDGDFSGRSTLSCTGCPAVLKVSSQCARSMSQVIPCHHALHRKCWTTSIWRKSSKEGSMFSSGVPSTSERQISPSCKSVIGGTLPRRPHDITPCMEVVPPFTVHVAAEAQERGGLGKMNCLAGWLTLLEDARRAARQKPTKLQSVGT